MRYRCSIGSNTRNIGNKWVNLQHYRHLLKKLGWKYTDRSNMENLNNNWLLGNQFFKTNEFVYLRRRQKFKKGKRKLERVIAYKCSFQFLQTLHLYVATGFKAGIPETSSSFVIRPNKSNWRGLLFKSLNTWFQTEALQRVFLKSLLYSRKVVNTFTLVSILVWNPFSMKFNTPWQITSKNNLIIIRSVNWSKYTAKISLIHWCAGNILLLEKGHSFVRKIFRKTVISYLLIRTRACVYQGVGNVSFSENFV